MKKNRLFGILLGLALVLGLMGAMGATAWADAVDTYPISTSVSPQGSGSVSVKVGSDIVTSASEGDTVTLTAAPEQDYQLSNISAKAMGQADTAGDIIEAIGNATFGTEIASVSVQDNALVYKNDGVVKERISSDTVVTKDSAGYICTTDHSSYLFVLDTEYRIVKILIENDRYYCDGVSDNLVGRDIDLTRDSTDKEKYSFGMPAAPVAVNAKFALAQTHTHTAGGQTITFKPWSGTTGLPTEAGNYYLTRDVDLSAAWTVPSGTVNLCLNGHKIRRKAGLDKDIKFSLVKVSSGAVLELFDEDNTGAITGGFAGTGGGVTVSGGSFTMNGGMISDNEADNAAGGVFISGGTFTMKNGSITRNKSAGNGGGVFVISGTFTMSGGSINGNSAGGNNGQGGGVFVSRSAGNDSFILNGGTIRENISGGDGGGVCANKNISLSGSAVITDNLKGSDKNNLYLANGIKLNVTAAMTNTTPIGVMMASPGVFTTSTDPVKASSYIEKFASDSSEYCVETKDNELALATVIKYPLWIGSEQVTSGNKDDVLGAADGAGATVSFTPASDGKSGTLTLNGADISGENGNYTQDEVYYDNYATIRTKLNELTLNVNADSSIAGPGTGIYQYGIYAKGCELTITGKGTLVATVSGNRTSFGVYAGNIIMDGKLSANAKTTDSWARSCGIAAENNITIKKGAELTASGTGDKGSAIYDYGTTNLINAIAGIGWTNAEGTEGQTSIDVNTTGQSVSALSQFKKIQFPVPAYTVKFTDGLGTILDTQYVEKGGAATAPAAPTRDGYTFNGWDTDFSSVRSDLTVTARWKQIVVTHKVTFEDGMGKVLDTQDVVDGRPATAPTAPTRSGYIFSGWDKDFSSVTADLTVKAQWTQESSKTDAYTVVFVFGFGNAPATVEVSKGGSATAPAVPQVDGFTFTGWDKEFTKVTSNMTVTAQWKKNTAGIEHTVVFVDGYSVNPLRIQRVRDGESAKPPKNPSRDGYIFDGWDTDFSYVTTNLTVIAQWKQGAVKTLTVNSGTVSAKTLDAALQKAGGSRNTVTTITLGKKVKKISKGAFKNYGKAGTLVVKTGKLTKKSVKASLKGSKVRTVKVKVGNKKTNKKYVKKYKKIFTKKNAGRKASVK